MDTLLDIIITPQKALIFLTLLLAVVLAFQMRSADPYGLFHLSLNESNANSFPVTEWLNMGYWRVSAARFMRNYDE